MKLLEIKDMVSMDDETHRVPNPLPNVIDSDNPVFGEVYDMFDEAREEGGRQLYKDWNDISYPEQARRFTAIDQHLGTITSVPLNALISTEPTVDPEHLQQLVMQGAKKGPAKVAKYQNKYYIIDGNHRVIMDAFNGKDSSDVLVIDLDKFVKEYDPS